MPAIAKYLFIFSFGLSVLRAQPYFSPVQLRNDVQFFKTIADKLHPGFLYKTNLSEVNRTYDSLINQLSDSMDIKMFFKKFNPLIQSYGDLHTFASYKNQFKNIRYGLPFVAYSENKRVWVIKSFTPLLQPGDEIKGINNISTDSIIQEMKRYTVNPDNSASAENVFEIRHTFTVLYAEFFPLSSTAEIMIERNHEIKKLQLTNLTSGDTGFKETSDFYYILNKIYKDASSEIRWGILDSINTAYLEIHGFDSFFKHFKQQKKFFKTLYVQKIQNLIIDLRDNPGGNYLLAGLWLEYMYDKPFKLIDTVYLLSKKRIPIDKKLVKRYSRFYWGFKNDKKRNIYYQLGFTFRPRKKYPYKGKVFVLINAQSMSSASIMAGSIKSKQRGILLGEETGNNYCAFCAGGGLSFELPNSGLLVRIPLNLMILETDKTQNNCNQTVQPHIRIAQNVTDLINGRDTQLVNLLNMIKSQ